MSVEKHKSIKVKINCNNGILVVWPSSKASKNA